MTYRILFLSIVVAGMAAAAPAWADKLSIKVHAISADGVGEAMGVVTAVDTEDGLLLTPDLAGLPPGEHGFHVHQNPSCDSAEKDGKTVAGLAAGGHYDPGNTGSHKGPKHEGHLGDLPVLVVNDDGEATKSVLAPRLTVAKIKGRALMVHAHGDNFSDAPEPLGGGGARIACGVID